MTTMTSAEQLILEMINRARMDPVEAMSAMTDGPRELLISAEKSQAESVLVVVRDSGPGLAESADRLFESFYTTKPGGLGMGLSICRSIIEAHRGRLWASANASRGAVFQFTLPAYSSAEENDS
jgi:signal transduction histidine kinase